MSGDRAARPDVVEDVGARLLLEHELGEERGQEVPVDELAGAVDEEATIGVPVPGDPEVGLLGQHAIDDELPVLRQQRIRLVIGKLAVGRPVGRHEVEVELLEQRRDHLSRHPVAAVDDHLHRLDRAHVDEREGSIVELLGDVDVLAAAAAGRIAEAREDEVADAGDARLTGERQSALADELDAGVGLRVVRGGDHRPAVEIPRADHEIEHLGADHAGVEDVDALVHQAVLDPAGHLRRLQAHVAADADAELRRRLLAQLREHPGEGPAEEVGGIPVHLVAVEAAHVVGLEDPLGHRARSTVGQLKPP